MLSRRAKLAALIVVVIIASGCTQSQNSDSSTTSPISVNSFEGVPNPAFADRRLSLSMELQNKGDLDAEDVSARIFGPTFATSPNDEKSWRNTQGGEVNLNERTKYFGDLRAPSENSQAIPKQKSWRFTAPNLGENREVDYTFYSKIYYKYQTTGETDFTLMSSERFHEEDRSDSDATIESTSGPIQLEIRGQTPKLFFLDDQNDAGEINSQVCIRLRNQGEGTPFIDGFLGENNNRHYLINRENENKVRISIQDIGNVEFNAQGKSKENQDIVVQMPAGNQGTQCFDMTVDENLVSNNPEQIVNTKVTVEYGYVKEDSTKIPVEGRRGSG